MLFATVCLSLRIIYVHVLLGFEKHCGAVIRSQSERANLLWLGDQLLMAVLCHLTAAPVNHKCPRRSTREALARCARAQ
eukprot:3731888-Amphidinium_carterae.1